MGKGRTHVVLSLGILLACCACSVASDPSVDVTQYVRTAWTSPDEFFMGNIYAMSQTPDGYLWGSEFGLFHFDGLRSIAWQAPAGQHLPDKNIYGLTMKAGSRGHREGRADSTPRHFQNIHAQGSHARVRDLKFTHLTTNDGLSQSNVTAILQDRRGFMWFATRDGLNRYDGNAFVVYKHNPNDPGSLSANYLQDLMVDDQGYLWIATLTGGADKFDPRTERFTRYRHDRSNANSISGDSVYSIARDSRGHLWFGTGDTGLDRFDPATGNFTHYLNDSDGLFVGKITHVIADRQGEIWFVGERGLFHLNPATGQITHPRATINSLAADYLDEDNVGNLWILAYSPIVGLVKYDRRTERFTKYSLGARAVGVANSKLLEDTQNGLWVPSSQGLQYFDRRTERFTRRFQHDESRPGYHQR